MQNAPAVAWREIIQEAVRRGVARGGPVPGSRLRLLVATIATERGLVYPPVGGPETSFSEFLSQFSDVAVTRHRPAQDFLVAPASQPELLIQPPKVSDSGPLPGIRRDLFDSFTRLSGLMRAWYIPNDDRVEWLALTTPPESQSWVAISQPTLEQAVAVRKRFAQGVSDSALQQKLVAATESPRALSDFGKLIRSAGLLRDWHKFRTSALVEIIKQWAQAAAITWQDSWITAASGEDRSFGPGWVPIRNGEASHDWRRALAYFAQTLDRDDLGRISIPLDIVLKALQQR
jgi:hypothetical protein